MESVFQMTDSESAIASLAAFEDLMARTDALLNEEAARRPGYYRTRSGTALEDDVKAALDECAMGTVFEGAVEKVSGKRFPDIVVAGLYGVEVKSTKGDHWTSTGSSILETTRVETVERVYLTFGKLGGERAEFLSRPYEECLNDIAVTHMPRYRIDMRLEPGETIFDKMDLSYDDLRRMDNPTVPVAQYCKGRLKPGESLWWTGDSAEEAVPATIRLWKTLSLDEKRAHTAYGCANFPEVYGGDYGRYALWLTSRGVVDPHIRDQFSAGGREDVLLPSGDLVDFPAVFRTTKRLRALIINRFRQLDPQDFSEDPEIDEAGLRERLLGWIDEVSRCSTEDGSLVKHVLETQIICVP